MGVIEVLPFFGIAGIMDAIFFEPFGNGCYCFEPTWNRQNNNLCEDKLIPNALRIHKSAMDTKIALTEAMRVKAYAVRISGTLFINQHSYRSPLLVRLLQSPDVQIQRYRISKGPKILPKSH